MATALTEVNGTGGAGADSTRAAKGQKVSERSFEDTASVLMKVKRNGEERRPMGTVGSLVSFANSTYASGESFRAGVIMADEARQKKQQGACDQIQKRVQKQASAPARLVAAIAAVKAKPSDKVSQDTWKKWLGVEKEVSVCGPQNTRQQALCSKIGAILKVKPPAALKAQAAELFLHQHGNLEQAF
jgi:hypothetical protein